MFFEKKWKQMWIIILKFAWTSQAKGPNQNMETMFQSNRAHSFKNT
jgi:hypothetical protein